MSALIKKLGTLVFTILSVSVPVIFGVSIGANWHPGIRILLGIGTIGEICIMSVWIYFETEEA